MGALYRHTQFGHVLVAGLGVGIAGASAAILAGGAPHAVVAVGAVLGLCLLMFPTLTVEVQTGRVRCFLGLGLIRRQIELRDVTSVTVVQNPWYYGWGLRRIPGGWMWNVSGLKAVELRFRNGSLFRIGTDDPEKLRTAISSAMGAG